MKLQYLHVNHNFIVDLKRDYSHLWLEPIALSVVNAINNKDRYKIITLEKSNPASAQKSFLEPNGRYSLGAYKNMLNFSTEFTGNTINVEEDLPIFETYADVWSLFIINALNQDNLLLNFVQNNINAIRNSVSIETKVFPKKLLKSSSYRNFLRKNVILNEKNLTSKDSADIITDDNLAKLFIEYLEKSKGLADIILSHINKIDFSSIYKYGCILSNENCNFISTLQSGDDVCQLFNSALINSYKRRDGEISHQKLLNSKKTAIDIYNKLPLNILSDDINCLFNTREKVKLGLIKFRELIALNRLGLYKKVYVSEDLIKKYNTLCSLYIELSKAIAPKVVTDEKLLELCDKSDFEIRLDKCPLEVVIQDMERDEDIKNKLVKFLPQDPKYLFPNARALKRHFVIHVGDTNSGKTYESLQRLKEAKSGMYLAPLRLLALEVQESLLNDDVRCSLLTGEEEDIVRFATHISSTVEKANLTDEFDVVVIDECQLIGDEKRGFAWTNSILGVISKEIHLCFAPEAKDIIIDMIRSCGDTYEVVEHQRATPLICEDNPVDITKDIRDGDALVVFSKRECLALAATLTELGISCSVLYGALPYNTRKAQYKRFLNKETSVIVCTDIVGMGCNLPILRVVYIGLVQKFDGKRTRNLTESEIKQISGRAGRKGIYDKGYVAAGNPLAMKRIKAVLNSETPKIKKAFTLPPDTILDIDEDIIDLLSKWKRLSLPEIYSKGSIDKIMFLLTELNKLNLDIDKRHVFYGCKLPFDERNPELMSLWREYLIAYSKGTINLLKPKRDENLSLKELELYYKKLELYYSFSKNFNYKIDLDRLRMEKHAVAMEINDIINLNISSYKQKCATCGTSLAWNCKHNECGRCIAVRKKQSRLFREVAISSTRLISTRRLNSSYKPK